MEKRRLFFGLSMCLLLVFASCTKSEIRTNKLLKKGRWMFTELTIGSNQVTLLPKWDISDAPNEKEFAAASWTHYDGSKCQFKWRFDYYEGTFSFKIDEAIEQDEMAKAYMQCDNLSGSYKVITEKSKLFEFESEESKGYPDVKVFIQIQPL